MNKEEQQLKRFKKALKRTKEYKELNDVFMVVVKWTYSKKIGIIQQEHI